MKFIDLFHKTGDCLYPDWETIMGIKEFRDLALCNQSTVWHKEGTVLPHTVAVTNHMVNFFKKNGLPMNDNYYIQMVSAALCHDLGKPSTTKWDEELQEYKTKCHGQVGARITRYLFFDEPDISLREKVCCMVKNHMVLHHLFDNEKEIEKKLKKMSWSLVSVKDMNILKYCDSMGSTNDIETDETKKRDAAKIKEKAIEYDCYEKAFNCNGQFETLKYFRNIEEAEEYPNFTVLILIGLPGAGKDTFLNEICEDHNVKRDPVLCRDTIRAEIGLKGEKPQGNKSEEDKVTHIFNERMKELCEQHQSFIINNTNLLKRYRDSYCDMIIRHGGKPIFAYVEAPTLEETKERRKGMIDPKVIDNMFWRFEFPDGYESSRPMFFRKQTNS